MNLREFTTIPSASVSACISVREPLCEPAPPTAFSEAFRSIRASLLLDSTVTQSNAIVVSSAHPGEGKTTIAVHLAIALANIGKRVLLIDGDLRSPQLHALLATPNEAGFSDLLASPLPLSEQQIAQTIHPTTQANLELLSSGPVDSGSPDLLYSSRLPELLSIARKNFDIVLIDSPPMVQIPDARILGRAADAIMIVVRANKTAREVLLAVRQRLIEDKIPMTGCVLNHWNHGPSSPYSGRARKPSTSSNPNPLAKLIPRKSSLSTQRPA